MAQSWFQEFQAFAKKRGFHDTRTSPHHHQSNGKVESAVKQAKKKVRIAQTTIIVIST